MTSSTLGGDDGAFYFPYILDPKTATPMLIGTCRVWRGPRSGGAFTALSPNFDTLGSGACSGNEVNLVRATCCGRSDGQQWLRRRLRDHQRAGSDGWPAVQPHGR